MTEQLRAWGAAHARARTAECAARQAPTPAHSPELQREAQALRERANALHREIYRSLDRKGGDKPG